MDKRTMLDDDVVVPRPAPALDLPDADGQQLRQWLAAFGTPQQVALRSQIVLAAAEGQSDNAIAQRLQVNRKTVTLWRPRLWQGRTDRLWGGGPGRGGQPNFGGGRSPWGWEATLRGEPRGRGPGG